MAWQIFVVLHLHFGQCGVELSGFKAVSPFGCERPQRRKVDMRRMTILSVAVAVMIFAGGCRLCDRLFRGSVFQPAPTVSAPVVCPPVVPANPCDPCNVCDPCGTAVVPGPVVVTPGSAGYAPAPIP